VQQEWTGEGLVFRVGQFRESDCWVRFFSPSHAMITAMAFGGAKSRRRFCGCLDALSRVLFKVRFFPVKGYYCLEEGTLLQSFPRLRTDARRTGLAANCLHFIQALQVDTRDAPGMYDLLVGMLDTINHAEQVSPIFPQLFRTKICFSQGYAPCLETCAACGRTMLTASSPRRMLLAVDQGRVFCLECAPGGGAHALKIGAETAALLDSLVSGHPAQWADPRVCATSRGEIFQVADRFVQYHLGLRWHNGRFVAA